MQVTDSSGNIFGPNGLQVNGSDGKPKVISSGGGGGSIPHGTASGTDTYTVSIAGATSYNDGDAYLVRFPNGNTTGSTLNINGLGAVSLYRNNDGQLIGGDIEDGGEMLCIYNSTLNVFQLIGTSPNTLLAYVTNAESITITKGQPVYAFGGQGDRLKVKLAYNTLDSTSAQTIGLVLSTSIGANQKGFVILNGQLDGLSILPTSTWADGDPVYLGATPGSITKTKPSAPNHLVYLGFVTTANNGSAGRMYVRVQNGYELNELHDVQISGLADNDLLQYDLATDLWQNKSLSSAGVQPLLTLTTTGSSGPATLTGSTLNIPQYGGGLTVGTTAIASGTNGRVLFQDAGVLQQDASFFWDNTNKRLGVGATPATNVRLDVRAQGALSSDIAFRVRNSADTVNTFAIQGDGNILQLINSTGAFTLQKGFNIGATNDSSVFQAYMSNSSGANRAGFLAQTAGAGSSYLFHDYGSSGGGGSTSGNLFHSTGSGAAYFNFASIGTNSNGFRFIKNTGATINNTEGKLFQVASSSVTWYQSVISIGTYCGASQSTTPVAAYGGNTLFIANGTAPTTTGADAFGLYSADIVAGNAAPHFRTENGDIVKLYRVGGWGLPTGTFTRTTFNTATVTTQQLAERVAALIQDLRDNHQLLKA